ncbi:MAG: hypothetical protein NXI22_22365 [bacterium]|nr:hypothetical protein [bacterium]
MSLPQIASKLCLVDVEHDAENFWEWVIGSFSDTQLDITRTHTKRRMAVEVRVFRLDNAPFTPEVSGTLVEHLQQFVQGPIRCGQWKYVSGNDFDLHLVEEYPGSAA